MLSSNGCGESADGERQQKYFAIWSAAKSLIRINFFGLKLCLEPDSMAAQVILNRQPRRGRSLGRAHITPAARSLVMPAILTKADNFTRGVEILR